MPDFKISVKGKDILDKMKRQGALNIINEKADTEALMKMAEFVEIPGAGKKFVSNFDTLKKVCLKMKSKEKINQGLKNPLAVATVANEVVKTEEGQKAIGQGVNAAKYLLVALGVVAVGRFGYSQFKKLRADRFAKENVGNPNLTAAAIIYESFTRVGFPSSSFLSMLIPSINISTDEDALYDIARQVTNVKTVSNAYYILFDRNLFTDIQKGLDTTELKRFWNIIASPSYNQNNKTLYPIGDDLYCAVKEGITVNQAEQINDEWKGTGKLYDNISFRESVGEIIDNGVWQHENGEKENYYIVKDYFFSIPPTRTGVVLQHQVTNQKI